MLVISNLSFSHNVFYTSEEEFPFEFWLVQTLSFSKDLRYGIFVNVWWEKYSVALESKVVSVLEWESQETHRWVTKRHDLT